MKDDAAMAVHHDGPDFERPGERDDRALSALVRRYEQTTYDIDQRLKDIVSLLRDMRAELRTERDRTDQLERDLVAHRNDLAERRDKAARKK